jgi:prepilin-type N-terminal cleavage/methylation domain-containing protein
VGSIRAKEAAVSHAADDRRRRGCPRSGFTLVELLVVIGIIALLVGLLMPVLAGVADRGRDIQCQANLRGIMQAMHGYAAEHDGQFPWGYVNNRMAPGTWSPAPGSSDEEAVCWAALVAQYWNKSVPPAVGTAGETIGDVQRHFTPALQCPDAMQYRDHEVSYAMSLVAGASPYIDVHLAGGIPPPLGALLRPVRQHQFGKDTAVLWDTALVVGTEYEPQVRMGLDIDGQRIWQGARSPQLRFLSARDPFQAVSGGTFAHNRPLELNLPEPRDDLRIRFLDIPGQPALPSPKEHGVQRRVCRRQREAVHGENEPRPLGPQPRRAAAILHAEVAARRAARPQLAALNVPRRGKPAGFRLTTAGSAGDIIQDKFSTSRICVGGRRPSAAPRTSDSLRAAA